MKECEIDEENIVDDTKVIYELINKVEYTKLITLMICYMLVPRCAPEIMMNNTKESIKDWPNRKDALLEVDIP